MGFHIKINGGTSPEHGECFLNFQRTLGKVPTFKSSGQVARLKRRPRSARAQETTDTRTPKKVRHRDEHDQRRANQ